MNDTNRRLVGYTLGALALSGLVYGGFVYEDEADAMTLLGAVEVHLKLAASMPELGTDGKPHPERSRLIRQARGFLERARAQDRQLFIGSEFAGWMCALEGDYAAAAEHYQKAQGGRGATAATREADLLNEVRMWRAARKPERALAALDTRSAPFSGANVTSSRVERMLVLEVLGRTDDASEIATKVVGETDAPVPLLDAGHLLARHQKMEVAESAYAKAASKDPIANYFLARLKVRRSELDTGLDLLKRAVTAQGSKVRAMLEHDRESWEAVSGDERFKSILSPGNKAAVPGR